MTKFGLLGAAAVALASALASPAMAQQVIYNPGYCAQFYPNANCQNKGPGNPYTDPNYRRNGGLSSGEWSNASADAAPRRTRRPHHSQ
jgi:ABC-type multidrug transport system permease subunit